MVKSFLESRSIKSKAEELCVMIFPFLSEAQVREYKTMHKRSKSFRERDRIKAILMLNAGYTYGQVGELLLMDEDSIRRWHNEYQTGGMENLLADRYEGGETKLSMEEQKQVSDYLGNHICLSAKEVCHYVEKHYGKKYTFKGMTDLLHRLGFAYKKPKHLPGKANREAQEEFIKQYEELKAKKNLQDKIYFMDGTHPLHNSQLSYGWIKKGKEKFIKANTGRNRVNINGAYNIEQHKAIVREDESINAQSTIALMEQIKEQQSEGNIFLIADNARYYRSKKVKEYLQQHERIKIIFLPPYSPNLNLIERLWKWVKKKVAYNKYYEKFSVFREKIMEVLKNIEQYKHELENLMTENFQLFPS